MVRSRGPELLVLGPSPWFAAEAQSRGTGREPGVNSVCLQVSSSAFLWPEVFLVCTLHPLQGGQTSVRGRWRILDSVSGCLRHTWQTRGWGPAEP